MDKTQAAKAITSPTLDVREKYAARIANHNRADMAATVYHNANLALNFLREGSERAGKIRRDNRLGGGGTLRQTLERL